MINWVLVLKSNRLINSNIEVRAGPKMTTLTDVINHYHGNLNEKDTADENVRLKQDKAYQRD